MDSIRISHIRRFANAISLALQEGHAHATLRGESHLKSVLDSFTVSHQTAIFTSTPAPAPVSEPVQLQVSVSVKQHVPVSVQLPALMIRANASELGVQHTLQAASLATVPVRRETPVQPNPAKGTPATLSSINAGRFFVSLPWGGQAISIQADVPATLLEISKPPQQMLATRFFVALPWTSRSMRTSLSIGAGQDDMSKAKSLSMLTGREGLDLPGVPRHLTGVASASTNASGFFRKLPWAGSKADHLHSI